MNAGVLGPVLEPLHMHAAGLACRGISKTHVNTATREVELQMVGGWWG